LQFVVVVDDVGRTTPVAGVVGIGVKVTPGAFIWFI
jgi:hypothetical protein